MIELVKLGLINSAWVQAGQKTAFGIRNAKEICFECVDIFADPLDIDMSERKLIKDECDRANLPIVSVACVAVGLIDFNPSVQRFHLDRVKAYLDMAYVFEAINIRLALGEYIWQRDVISPAEQWQTAMTNTRLLGECAEKLGLRIALELEPFHLSLLNDVESMSQFLCDVDSPAVGAKLDVSHLFIAGQPASSLERLRGKIFHIHISDCDGKVHGDLPPGRGVVDFPPYLEAIKRLGLSDLAMSIELEYSPQPEKIEDWVTEAYENTASLLSDAGLRS